MNRLFYILILLALIPACSSSPVIRQLSAAEELMTDHPDSALTMLRNIDTTALTAKSERALYALLLSQALDKNYIDLKSDSIISFASEYYALSDDQYHNMLAQYYLGRVKYNAGDYPHSLVAMFKAHDLAKELNLNFWIAMTARGIADVYTETYNNADAVIYSEIALHNMKIHGDARHIIYAMVDLVQAYHNNLDYAKGISLAHNALDSLKKHNNEGELYTHILRILGKSYIGTGNYSKSVQCFKMISKTSFMLTSDSAFWGIASIGISDYTTANKLFNKIITHPESMSEWLQYKISEYNGDTKNALVALAKMYDTTNESLKVRVRQNLSASLVNYYNFERLKKQDQLKNTRIILNLVLILGIFVIIGGVILALRYYNRQQNTINQNIAIATNLREILSIKETEYISAQNSIHQLLNSKFDMIDKLCQLYYESESTELTKKRISNAVSDIIEQLSSNSKKLSQLENYLNTHANNIMSDFRNDFPKLKDVDYRLFLYLSLGFSVNAIALFLGETKITSIYERKRRLKDKIKKLNEPMKSRYLQFIT